MSVRSPSQSSMPLPSPSAGVSPFVKPGDIRFTFWKAVIVIMDQVVIGHSLCDWNSENRWMMRISALFGPPGLSASGKSLDSSVQETNATGNDRGAILIIKRNPFNSLPLYVQNHPSICFSIGMSVPGIAKNQGNLKAKGLFMN